MEKRENTITHPCALYVSHIRAIFARYYNIISNAVYVRIHNNLHPIHITIIISNDFPKRYQKRNNIIVLP